MPFQHLAQTECWCVILLVLWHPQQCNLTAKQQTPSPTQNPECMATSFSFSQVAMIMNKIEGNNQDELE